MAEAEKIAVAEGMTQAQVLRRWLREKLLGGGSIQEIKIPPMGAEELAFRDQLGREDLAELTELKASMSRPDTLDKIIESRNVTAADAMASVSPKVRAAKAIAKIQKKSSGAAVRLGVPVREVVPELMALQRRLEGRELRDGVPCGHPGCLSHISHPCEGCGRSAGGLITVIYACGHSSDPHNRLDLGPYDTNPVNCECKTCWPESVKDLRTVGSAQLCPQCDGAWIAQKAVEEDGALVGAARSPVEEAPSCPECFKYFVRVKGKWVCKTPGCTLEGLVQ